MYLAHLLLSLKISLTCLNTLMSLTTSLKSSHLYPHLHPQSLLVSPRASITLSGTAMSINKGSDFKLFSTLLNSSNLSEKSRRCFERHLPKALQTRRRLLAKIHLHGMTIFYLISSSKKQLFSYRHPLATSRLPLSLANIKISFQILNNID
jgi:hypothetical protein